MMASLNYSVKYQLEGQMAEQSVTCKCSCRYSTGLGKTADLCTLLSPLSKKPRGLKWFSSATVKLYSNKQAYNIHYIKYPIGTSNVAAGLNDKHVL